jgi:amidohydrolase
MPRPDFTAQIKAEAQAAIQAGATQLIRVSEQLHRNPETAWQEHESAALLVDELRGADFEVEPQYLGLKTAFRAVRGTGGFRVGLMAEYDALPGVGHACGHNLIAAMSLGAGVALAQVAARIGATIEVYGTPAEEGGGGKIEMLDRGAFGGLDVAMMAHPAPVDVAEAAPIAVAHWRVAYHGKSAHAAAYPTEAINAADAFTVAQVAIGLLRQQLPSGVRVHGVVTNAGQAPNAIPGYAEGRWYVRAETGAELEALTRRVEDCFRAGALATGCELVLETESKPYTEFRTDRALLDRYVANATALGRRFETDGPATTMARASTDMGNVSQVVRAIHPYIGLDCFPVSNHQSEFADRCVGPTADRALVDGATALAWTAIDAALEATADQAAEARS